MSLIVKGFYGQAGIGVDKDEREDNNERVWGREKAKRIFIDRAHHRYWHHQYFSRNRLLQLAALRGKRQSAHSGEGNGG